MASSARPSRRTCHHSLREILNSQVRAVGLLCLAAGLSARGRRRWGDQRAGRSLLRALRGAERSGPKGISIDAAFSDVLEETLKPERAYQLGRKKRRLPHPKSPDRTSAGHHRRSLRSELVCNLRLDRILHCSARKRHVHRARRPGHIPTAVISAVENGHTPMSRAGS